MSTLRVFKHDKGDLPLATVREHAEIARELAGFGVRFERWETRHELPPGAAADEVIRAYQADIDRLKQEHGYQSVDVISMTPDHPQREGLRDKFLSEHTHAEDEVRFFVAGRGQFTLHIGDKVLDVLCEQGDLIGVPAGTPHWFDMSDQPSFIAIRLFTNKDGWIADFTGDNIADRFPRMSSGAQPT